MVEQKIKTKQGLVISNKMDKSAVVKITRQVKHPKYKKYIKRTTKIMAHDKDNKTQIGDLVTIKEVKPISKNKNWELVEIVREAKK